MPKDYIHCNKCETSLILKPKAGSFLGIPMPRDTPFCPKCGKWRNKSTIHYAYDDCCKRQTIVPEKSKGEST
jgi:hypothetical protein